MYTITNGGRQKFLQTRPLPFSSTINAFIFKTDSFALDDAVNSPREIQAMNKLQEAICTERYCNRNLWSHRTNFPTLIKKNLSEVRNAACS